MIFLYFICFFIGFTINTSDEFVIAQSVIPLTFAKKSVPFAALLIQSSFDIDKKLTIKLPLKNVYLACSHNISTAAINKQYLIIVASNAALTRNCITLHSDPQQITKRFISIYCHSDYQTFELMNQEEIAPDLFKKMLSINLGSSHISIKTEDGLEHKINLSTKVVNDTQKLNLKVIRTVHKNDDENKDEHHHHKEEDDDDDEAEDKTESDTNSDTNANEDSESDESEIEDPESEESEIDKDEPKEADESANDETEEKETEEEMSEEEKNDSNLINVNNLAAAKNLNPSHKDAIPPINFNNVLNKESQNNNESKIKPPSSKNPRNYFSILKNKTPWLCGVVIVTPLTLMKVFGTSIVNFFNRLKL